MNCGVGISPKFDLLPSGQGVGHILNIWTFEMLQHFPSVHIIDSQGSFNRGDENGLAGPEIDLANVNPRASRCGDVECYIRI